MSKDIHQEVAKLRRRGWRDERKPGSNVVTLTHEATGAIVKASLSANPSFALSKLRRAVQRVEGLRVIDAQPKGAQP